MLPDRLSYHLHLGILQRLVSWCGTTLLYFAVNEFHVPVIPEQFHNFDAISNTMAWNTLNKPVAFGLQDNLFMVCALIVQVRRPGLVLHILYYLSRVLGDFVRSFLISHYATEYCIDVLIVENVDKLGSLNPICFLPGKLFWPHPREGNVNTHKLRKECLVPVAVDFPQNPFHVSVGGQETFPRPQSFPIPEFVLHQRINRWVLRPHGRLGRHMPGDPLGIANHCQQVAGC